MEYMPACRVSAMCFHQMARGEKVFIVIYERYMNRDGTPAERPLAMFRNPLEARVFVNMLATNGRNAYAATV
jgi:hypothetical protein